MGPQHVIDSYQVSLLSGSEVIFRQELTSTSINITVMYNTIYNATVSSVNCAGKSPPLALLNITICKCRHNHFTLNLYNF